jgi:predicted RNase H-like nuclease
LSRQAYGLLPKVQEVDRLMTPERQRHVVEVHPEVSFTVMAGRPMAHSKKTPAGRAERLDTLRPVFPDIAVHTGSRLVGANSDDIVDAFAVAWSARRWLTRTYVRLGGERDERGLRMEIIV